MTAKLDEIKALKAHRELPIQRLAQLRSAGMHAIRFEFVCRLLRAEVRMDTLSIFWDHSAASLLERKAGDATWRLVLGRGHRTTAEFPDLWVLCYPEDAEIKQQVEAELDRLIERVRVHAAEVQRARGPLTLPPRAVPDAPLPPARGRGV